MGPDPGEKVGLKFQSDGELVVFAFRDAALLTVDFRGVAEELLNMVSYFVSNHVGGGKVVVPGPVACHLAELLEELHVEIDGFFGGDVEGAGGCLSNAASAHSGRSGIVDELGRAILEIIFGENLGPFIFG